MKFRNVLSFSVLVAAVGFLNTANAATGDQPDNTAINQRDQSPHEMKAQDQGDSKTDIDLTTKIRQAVVAQKGFSTYAKNIKIITSGGQVTLKGPVKTADEKSQIELLAKRVAGDSKVSNQIEIKQ